MPHQVLGQLCQFFGFIAWGDVNEVTVYRDKQGKMIWFPKTWPDKPPSVAQLVQRQRFTDAAVDWKALNDTQREQWHLAARRANLTMHGYDLYIHWKMTLDNTAIETLERQTNTSLLPP